MSRTAEAQLLGLVQSEAGLELELMKERASALGHAGDQLSATLKRYRQADEDVQRKELCADAAYRLWALIVQREALGLALGNLEWIRTSFDIPREIWQTYCKI
jgi:hypothetical protein